MIPMRELGASGLSISPLVLGGNVFGWTADKAASFRILDRFVERPRLARGDSAGGGVVVARAAGGKRQQQAEREGQTDHSMISLPSGMSADETLPE